jgi:hypothetical protein
MDSLFYGVGGNLQTFGKVIAWIGTVCSIIGGIIMFFCAFINLDYLWWLMLLAPVTAVVGCVSSWLPALVLYGFGQLIDDTEDIRRQISKVNDQNKNDQPASQSTTCQVEETLTNEVEEEMPCPVEESDNNVDNTASDTTYTVTKKNTIICSTCHVEQPNDRSVCWNCGSKFQ